MIENRQIYSLDDDEFVGVLVCSLSVIVPFRIHEQSNTKIRKKIKKRERERDELHKER